MAFAGPLTILGAMTEEELRCVAVMVASEGALLARARFRTGARSSAKTGFEIVTVVDLAVENHVRQRLTELVPGALVIGEEGGSGAGPERSADGDPNTLLAFVDPIDGTTNYAHGHPFYATSIGFARGGRAVAGAVVAPSLHQTWSAAADGPALRGDTSCVVSDTAELSSALLATGFPYDRRSSDDDNLRAFAALKKQSQGIRRCGSAAIDLCLVADGTYDGYWERKLMPWDVAAGVLIAERAGARLTDDRGGAYVLPSTPERTHVLAANPGLHAVLLAALLAVDPCG